MRWTSGNGNPVCKLCSQEIKIQLWMAGKDFHPGINCLVINQGWTVIKHRQKVTGRDAGECEPGCVYEERGRIAISAG